jgi:hypothetical protein
MNAAADQILAVGGEEAGPDLTSLRRMVLK